MKTAKIFVIVFSSLILSCEESINIDSMSEVTELIAVEGIITNERTNHRVRLTFPFQDQNDTPAPVTGASVRIYENGNRIDLTEFPSNSGNYYTPMMRATSRTNYILLIEYGEKQYHATDESVPVEPLPALALNRHSNLWSIDFSASGENPNYITYAVDWSETNACAGNESCEGAMVFYDLNTIDVNEVYKPKQTIFEFPAGSTIIRKKYSVSPAYRSFLRSMLSETRWRGGIFDVQQENASTNLSEGAIGFFAVSTVVSDTTVVSE
jgi:hypothetical protein